MEELSGFFLIFLQLSQPQFTFILSIMLTINLIREKKDFVIERLKIKNFDAAGIIARILELDSLRREIQTESDRCFLR